jgi:hypothetical protein
MASAEGRGASAAEFAGGFRALSCFLGIMVLCLAVASALGAPPPDRILAWAAGVLGVAFMALMSVLVLATIYCWQRLLAGTASPLQRQAWHEAGLHAANGIATLALTYTLFGISLGIGDLAGQNLTPDTVQAVIRGLTERFSLAFMTTVIGLPTSALLRALLSITAAWIDAKTSEKGLMKCVS